MNDNDTAAIIEMVMILYLLIQIVLLFLFIRMSHDIHKLKKKWVDQVHFTGSGKTFSPTLNKEGLIE